MSEPKSIPHVTTTPKPFGVNVEWKWPEKSHWFSRLELQYLLSDGRLEKEFISWPVKEKHISGLKAGERLQVRLRPVAYDGSARDWRASDWIEGVSSVDAGEIVEALKEEIRNSCALHGLEGGWFVDKTGKAYIHKALIGDGIVSANYSVKVNGDTSEHHAASMAIGVEGEQPRVVFKADQFKVATGGPLTLTEVVLSEPMRKAVINAVSESDLLYPLLSGLNEQEADITRLQLAIKDAVNDGIRNALKPGGLLWNNIRGR